MTPTVPIPSYLRRQPRDRRGFPIPFVVYRPDGPAPAEFAVLDPEKWKRCVYGHVCALCSKAFKGGIRTASGILFPDGNHYFIGGPLCYTNRLFFDPAMCEPCARYALQVCPYLAMPSYQKRMPPKPDWNAIMETVGTARPAKFMLGRTTGFMLTEVGGELLIRAKPWLDLEWWNEGKRVE